MTGNARTMTNCGRNVTALVTISPPANSPAAWSGRTARAITMSTFDRAKNASRAWVLWATSVSAPRPCMFRSREGGAGRVPRRDRLAQATARGTSVPSATPTIAAAVDGCRASATTPQVNRATPIETNTAASGHQRPSPCRRPARAPTIVSTPDATARATRLSQESRSRTTFSAGAASRVTPVSPRAPRVAARQISDSTRARSPATATRRAPVACSPRASTLRTMRMPMTAENCPNPDGPMRRAAATVSP